MKRIRLIFFAAVMLFICSCAKMAPGEQPADEKQPAEEVKPSIIVRGGCLDSVTSDPVSRIMIVLTALDGTQTPHRDTTYTSSEGLFELVSTIQEGILDYNLMAKDKDGEENGGSYQTAYIDITLNQNSPSFDEVTGGYLLEGNIFYMERD